MCTCLHENSVLCKAKRNGYSVDDDPIEPCKCACHVGVDIASGEDKTLKTYYCKGDGFHAVIEEQNEKFAAEYFVYLMNEMLEPEKGITVKDVVCEPVNIYNYKREEIVGEDLLDAISWMFAAKKSHPSLLLPTWVTQRQVSRIP